MIMVNILILFAIDGIMDARLVKFSNDNLPNMRYIYPRWNSTLRITETMAEKNVAIFYLLLNTLLPLALVIGIELVK